MQKIDWSFWSLRQALPAAVTVVFTTGYASPIVPRGMEGITKQLLQIVGMRQLAMAKAAGTPYGGTP